MDSLFNQMLNNRESAACDIWFASRFVIHIKKPYCTIYYSIYTTVYLMSFCNITYWWAGASYLAPHKIIDWSYCSTLCGFYGLRVFFTSLTLVTYLFSATTILPNPYYDATTRSTAIINLHYCCFVCRYCQ